MYYVSVLVVVSNLNLTSRHIRASESDSDSEAHQHFNLKLPTQILDRFPLILDSVSDSDSEVTYLVVVFGPPGLTYLGMIPSGPCALQVVKLQVME